MNPNAYVNFEAPQSKAKIVLKSFLTGRDEQAIDMALRSQITIDVKDGDTTPHGSFTADADIAGNNKAIEVMVVSVNGNEENVLDAVLDLPAQDTKAVIAKINEITNSQGLTEEKKSNSLETSSEPVEAQLTNPKIQV